MKQYLKSEDRLLRLSEAARRFHALVFFALRAAVIGFLGYQIFRGLEHFNSLFARLTLF